MKIEKEIYSLTGLRFVAAFYVFLFHIHLSWPLTSNEFLRNILGQGAIGMSLFFILSGFVLSLRYLNEKISLKKYFANRFARIYPIYLISAIVTIPWLGVNFTGVSSIFEVSTILLKGFILVFTNIFLIQAWFPQFFVFWNDGGSWSISVEVFCYLMLPIILPLLAQLSPKKFLFVLFGLYILAILPGIVGLAFPGMPFSVYYSMPIFRLPEFLIGVCILLMLRHFGMIRSYWVAQLFQVISIFFYCDVFRVLWTSSSQLYWPQLDSNSLYLIFYFYTFEQ